MNVWKSPPSVYVFALLLAFAVLGARLAAADLHLGSEQSVQAAGSDIDVPGYSVPSFTHWDGDELKDLLVGEGSGTYTPKLRVYLNAGTAGSPQFGDFFYAQSDGADLTVPGGGCLGLFPRVVYWDADDCKDLLIGQADGKIKVFLNVGTDDAPAFDGGTFVQVGAPGLKTDIDVGARATSSTIDWNNDGRKDLASGAYDGKIHIFLNEGTNTEPDFRSETLAQADGADLVVPSSRSSPFVGDLDDDGRKDLLTGNTNGQLLLYRNVGTDDAPSFSGYSNIEADDVPIDLPGTPRSRPFVCDWNDDGLLDVLIGSGDGRVHLYLGHCVTDVDDDGDTDLSDLATLLTAYGATSGDPQYNANADFDGDGDVDLSDLAFLLGGYGCTPGDSATGL
jgi:hypothetical protein